MNLDNIKTFFIEKVLTIEFIKNYWMYLVLLLIVIFIIIRTEKRGYFWKIKKTNETLKLKEFLKRWKNGVEGITPLQIARTEVIGGAITMVGLLSGITTMSIVQPRGMWIWIVASLSGGLILNTMGEVGFLQKYWRTKKIEDEIKKIQEKMDKNVKKNLNKKCYVKCTGKRKGMGDMGMKIK